MNTSTHVNPQVSKPAEQNATVDNKTLTAHYDARYEEYLKSKGISESSPAGTPKVESQNAPVVEPSVHSPEAAVGYEKDYYAYPENYRVAPERPIPGVHIDEAKSDWRAKFSEMGEKVSKLTSELGENYAGKFNHEHFGQRVLTQTTAYVAASVALGSIIDTVRGKKVIIDDGQGNVVPTRKHDVKAGAEGIALAAGIAALGLINVAGKTRL